MAGAHTEYSPSAFHRLITCPGSHLLTRDMPDEPSEDAMLGTAAHAVHEYCLLTEAPADWLLGDVKIIVEGELNKSFTVDQEMADAVQESIDRIYDIMAEHRREGRDPVLYPERQVDVSRWTPIPDQKGRSDCFVLADTILDVIDYKHGKGVIVGADHNPQMAGYGLGALFELDEFEQVETIRLHIHQPRVGHFDTWEVSRADLLAFGDYIRQRLALTRQHDAPFQPEEKACKFCKAKPTCAALAQVAYTLYSGAFDDLTVGLEIQVEKAEVPEFGESVNVKILQPDQLAKLWKYHKMIDDWLKSVDQHVEHLLLSGEKLKGLKLVEGRSFRNWKNEKGAQNFLLTCGVGYDDLWDISLKTPSVLEKQIPRKKRNDLAVFIDKSPGKPTVALETDKREAIVPMTDAFDDLTEDELFGFD